MKFNELNEKFISEKAEDMGFDIDRIDNIIVNGLALRVDEWKKEKKKLLGKASSWSDLDDVSQKKAKKAAQEWLKKMKSVMDASLRI